jgi:hypothetical protein
MHWILQKKTMLLRGLDPPSIHSTHVTIITGSSRVKNVSLSAFLPDYRQPLPPPNEMPSICKPQLDGQQPMDSHFSPHRRCCLGARARSDLERARVAKELFFPPTAAAAAATEGMSV